MIIGVGIDLEEVRRFKRVTRRPERLLAQVFSREEQRVFWVQDEPLMHFAAAFAVKEATFKALGQAWLESSLFWTDIELLSALHELPLRVRLKGAAEARSRALGATRVLAGVSHHKKLVMAQILVVSD